MTTLEEVFIKANGEDKPEENEPVKEKDVDDVDMADAQDKLLEGDANREHRGSSINREDQPMSGQLLTQSKKSSKRDDEFDGGSVDTPSTAQNEMSSQNLVGNGSLCESIKALIVKRFNIYKRDKCGLVCEIIVPVILVLMGLGLLQIPWITDSDSFYLTTDAYPGPQNIVMNEENYVSSVQEYTPEQLAKALPDYD